MCGIVGAWSAEGLGDTDTLAQRLGIMASMVAHRGPDGQGVWTDDHVGLGHARLAVIDLTDTGAQPMSSSLGSVHITYNGEIYNYRELRAELLALGHDFRSQSDTEVIVEGYRHWGTAVLERLRGMFALAIWDGEKRQLHLARDRVGQKPLYYCWHDGLLLFASEIKGLLVWPGVPRTPDLEAIHQYLSFQYVPSPRTAFIGVRSLLPATCMTVNADGDTTTESYWSLPAPATAVRRPLSDLKEELRHHLDVAVKYRMVSDVPLGVFLSGGIDSASVAASMALASDQTVKTFTIGFDDQGFDEREIARTVVERYGTDHHEQVVRPDAIDILPKLVWHYGEPFADSSAIPTYFLAQFARDHVTVALNGDGGDESFLGYPRYAGAKLGDRVDALPGFVRRSLGWLGRTMPGETSSIRQLRYLRRFLREADVSPIERYWQWITFFSEDQKSAIYTGELRDRLEQNCLKEFEKWFCGDTDAAAAAAWADIHTYLPDDLLVKIDVATMAHGLEARSPFLDHSFMEFAASIKADSKMTLFNTKTLLKSSMAERLPRRVLDAPKRGFGVPIDRWIRDDLREMCFDVLLSDQARSRGLFETEAVRKLLVDHIEGRHANHYRIWALLVLELWFSMWIDPPSVTRIHT